VRLIAALAILVIFVSGLFTGTVPTALSIAGAALALAAWAYALVIAGRIRMTDWVTVLVVGLLVALGLAAMSLAQVGNEGIGAALQLGFFALAFIALGFSSLGGAGFLERGVAAFFGGWALLTLVIGGTLVGGAIGTTTGAASAHITALGFRLYIDAGVFGLISWIVGLVVGLRTQSWGWFALIVCLPGIGAFMFGLFGPTRQDVLMARENARQRKLVGLS